MKAILTLLLCCLGIVANAQLSSEAKKALYNQDLNALRTAYLQSSAEQKVQIEDAMCNSLVNWDDFSYEQLIGEKTQEGNRFQRILDQQVFIKEQQIISEVAELDAGQVGLYLEHFPKRTDIVMSYLSNVLYSRLDSIPFVQVDYLFRNLALEDNEQIQANYIKREGERFAMVRSKLNDYCKIEASFREQIELVVKVAAWQYLNRGFLEVAQTYSNVGIVPDDPYDIASQLNAIVRYYLTPKDFMVQLQSEVDRYNDQVNTARAEFADMAGVKGYPKLDLTLPNIGNFNYADNYDLLYLIPKARTSFVQSRENISDVADVASWIVGPLLSAVGRGLLDTYAVSGLADTEIGARKKLLQDIYSQLKKKVQQYCDGISSNIRKQIENNQAKFKSYVQNYK